jgi:hypothetical protein
MTDVNDPPAESTFTCPRCSSEVTERFWGPCTACREELNRLMTARAERGEGFEPARFEPAMHVTPNHVATKD